MAAAVILICLCNTSTAAAGPTYQTFGFGAGIKMVKSSTQFKMTQELGHHFFWGSGPCLALSLAESFGENHVIFQVGPKFLWQILLGRSRGVLFYGAPTLQPGYSLIAPSGGDASHYFNLQLGFELKLHIKRFVLFLRPVGLDMFMDGDVFRMRYDIISGIGFTF